MNAKWVMRGFYAVLLGAILFLGGLSVKDLINPPPVKKVEAQPKETREDFVSDVKRKIDYLTHDSNEALDDMKEEENPDYDSELDSLQRYVDRLGCYSDYECTDEESALLDTFKTMAQYYTDSLDRWASYGIPVEGTYEARKKVLYRSQMEYYDDQLYDLYFKLKDLK